MADRFKQEQLKESNSLFCYCCNRPEWSSKKARSTLKAELFADNDDTADIAEYDYAQEQERIENENASILAEFSDYFVR